VREEDKKVSKNGKVMGRKCFALPEKNQFMEDCLKLDYRDVAKKYSVSRPTINSWREKFGFTKGVRK
jgi:hypothetical protein